ALDEHADLGRAEPHAIAVVDATLAHALAVHERPVPAREVVEDDALGRQLEPAMNARDLRIAEPDVVLERAAERDERALAELERLAGVSTLDDVKLGEHMPPILAGPRRITTRAAAAVVCPTAPPGLSSPRPSRVGEGRSRWPIPRCARTRTTSRR